jgi:hypothetical protein
MRALTVFRHRCAGLLFVLVEHEPHRLLRGQRLPVLVDNRRRGGGQHSGVAQFGDNLLEVDVQQVVVLLAEALEVIGPAET